MPRRAKLKELLQRDQARWEMIGDSPAMHDVFHLIARAGPTDKAILIQGESGSGKELVARALHRQSPRADEPLVVINYEALPETLLESELFGHEKGFFTGAVAAKQGLFELADEGTLLSTKSVRCQARCRRNCCGCWRTARCASRLAKRAAASRRRLLAATNRNLEAEVEAGRSVKTSSTASM